MSNKRCRTYRQFLALRLHAKQFQRPAQHWPLRGLARARWREDMEANDLRAFGF